MGNAEEHSSACRNLNGETVGRKVCRFFLYISISTLYIKICMKVIIIMFSFEENKGNVIEHCIAEDDARDKYPDKYMAVMNIRIENARLVGDIAALFSIEEYKKITIKEELGDAFDMGWMGYNKQRREARSI